MSDDLRFHVPPSYQGQIVEVSYALTPVGVIERTYDRSDRTTSYRVASWTSRLESWSESSGPWNTPPPSARWRRLTTNERRELGLDESVQHATKTPLRVHARTAKSSRRSGFLAPEVRYAGTSLAPPPRAQTAADRRRIATEVDSLIESIANNKK